MANPFAGENINPLQALLMQRQGADDAFQAQLRPLHLREQQGRLQARDQLSQLLQGGGTPDYGRLAAGLAAAGDTATAGVLATLGNQGAQRAFQERQFAATLENQQSERAFRERQLGISERQAGKPQYQVIEDAAGNKQLVRLPSDGGEPSVVSPTGMGGAPTNPYASGKSTESQSKDQLFANRMFSSERILRDTEETGTDFAERAKSKVPIIGNYLVSQDMQSLDQAKRDFINAVLRRESGAVIAESEFSNAERQYFPQPGDSKQTIAQKRRNRMEAIKGIAGAGGQGYRPPFTFDEGGEMVPNGAVNPPSPMGSVTGSPMAQRAAAGLTPIQGPNRAPAAATDIRSQAQDAIRRGADPRAVAQRLLQNGFDPEELGLSWESP